MRRRLRHIAVGDSPVVAQRQLRGYLDEVSRADVSRVDGTRRDPAGVRRLLASLARNSSTDATLKTLSQDVGGNGHVLHPRTVKSYLEGACQKVCVTGVI